MDENNNREIAIQLSGVKKRYKLGQIGGGTLQGDLQSWWARVRGKDDPNTKIGMDQRLTGQTFMALNGIDLTVYKGEALGIIGANGAGKSTMLKLLSRVTAPTEGEIDIYGRIASMLEVGTGFNGEMTGRENIYMNGAILGMTKAEIDEKMEQIIDFSEVRDFIDTPVKRYSSGMYVKLAFSVAAHLDSEIMIMDEVLAVGDTKFQSKCLKTMRDVAKKEGRTVLYVSHNMNTIRMLCDRCVVLEQGKVIFSGDVEKAIQIYQGTRFDCKSFVSFDNMPRDPWFSTDEIELKSFEIIDRKAPVYSVGEKLRGTLKFNVKTSVENISIVVGIKSDEGFPVTMTTSEPRNYTDIGHRQVRIIIDTSHLAPAIYRITLAAFQIDEETESYANLDGVVDIMTFEIVATNNFNRSIPWRTKIWGYHFVDPIIDE